MGLLRCVGCLAGPAGTTHPCLWHVGRCGFSRGVPLAVGWVARACTGAMGPSPEFVSRGGWHCLHPEFKWPDLCLQVDSYSAGACGRTPRTICVSKSTNPGLRMMYISTALSTTGPDFPPPVLLALGQPLRLPISTLRAPCESNSSRTGASARLLSAALEEGSPRARQGSWDISTDVAIRDGAGRNPPGHGGPAGGRRPAACARSWAGDFVAFFIVMLGSVSGLICYCPASPVAPCLPRDHRGKHWCACLPGAPPGAGGVQANILVWTLLSTPRPPVSFYIGVAMQLVQEMSYLALMLGAPATYSRHRTSLLTAARLLFWLPPNSRGEGWPDLRCRAPDELGTCAGHASRQWRYGRGSRCS